ncbi:hypothetical protein [Sunxiuqinia elliptica]|uniref:Uncharacterized protein n=1 Tax=Sunxiuqinia elliptica TaxID=655355 RepID=A0A4R6H5T4_9BACT|nr:hypothetical protein [Sunxiuqinia elliptica]TDO03257.1 hypothetical protein DET52_103201 [Sunxiuqinia elliptica]TDO59454.1 hypothetical protein DET65_2743 [Sunxiuqinia elliptica]
MTHFGINVTFCRRLWQQKQQGFWMIGLIVGLFACGQRNSSQEQPDKFNVVYSEGHLSCEFQLPDKQLEVAFFPCGVNQIFALGKLAYDTSSVISEEKPYALEFPSVTDWVGPYQVSLLENATSDLPKQFTGGWHGSNGDGTGEPTAMTKRVAVTVDGEPKSSGFSRMSEQVSLNVVNLIQGYDNSGTGNYLLQESVNYQVLSNCSIKVRVTITALNDVVIHRYYGMQSQNFAVFDSVSYASPTEIMNTEPVRTNNSCLKNDAVNRIILSGEQGEYELELILNTEKGLGTFDYLADGLARAFSADYGKSYFNLVNGKNLKLKKGELVFWEGTYVFK